MSRRGERTPEEREAARRERERRRYERAGKALPPHLLEPDEQPAAPAPPPVAIDPPAPADPLPPPAPPVYGDVDDDPFAPSHADDLPPPAADVDRHVEVDDPLHRHDPLHGHDELHGHDPQATQQWDVDEAWAHEEQAPTAPEIADDSAPDPQATQAHDMRAEWEAEPWTDEHAAAANGPLPSAFEDDEAPLGTRRVTGRERHHLPHIHRPSRGGRDRRAGTGRGVRVKRPGEAFGPPGARRSIAGRIVAVVLVAAVAALAWFLISLFQPFGGGGEGSGRVAVTIPQGANAGKIGAILEERGVVASGFFFGVRATVSGERGNLKSGRYTLRRDMSYAAALDVLTKVAEPAAVPTVTVAIPEGRSRRESATIASRNGLRGDYVAASRRSRRLDPRRYGAPAGASLEGFLFPATYELRRGANVRQLVDDQLRAFQQNFAGIDLGYARSRQLNAYDVLTIASMVEREVSVARERPLVAAVIYNRLRASIPLGIDATLRFEQNDWVNPLRQSVLDAETPYNTRVKVGLPPGPIGNPGLASIKAAARPARTDALYYVVKPGTCGEHAFAKSYDEHLQNVARYNQARDAAGGKSPTKC